MTALVKSEPQHLQQRPTGELTVQDLVDRKRKILDVMHAVMVEGEHYGKIPGCGDKPTLLKAGAEVLATTFGLAPRFKVTKTDLGNGHREVEVTCELVSIGTEKVLGEGLGSCSTMESKYRWRQGKRVCPACGSDAIRLSKHKPEWFCWAKLGGCGETFAKDDPSVADQQVDRVENPDIADTYNTVLKMAKKRAQVDATLTVTGASDLLTQDIEDLPPASREYDKPRNENRREPVEDAEYTDVSGGYGEKPRGPDVDHRTLNRTGDGEAPTRDAPPMSALEKEATEIVELIRACTTSAAVKALGPRASKLPKDSEERKFVSGVYNTQIATLERAHAGALA
jgi:hypothetical protein